MKIKSLKFESINTNDELITIIILANCEIKKAVEVKDILLKSHSIHREKNNGYWSKVRTLQPGAVYSVNDSYEAQPLDKLLCNYINVKNKYYNKWQDNFCNN